MADDAERSPQSPVGDRREYADFAGRIAGILSAAETAAAEIRADAEQVGEELRRRAAAEADAYATDRRREADEEAERVRAQAAKDAAAAREAVYAAARRVSEEGTQSLEQLRTEARALEGRFETAVDNLRDLMSQLADVLVDAGREGPAGAQPASDPAEGEVEAPVGAWDEPDAEDADRASLDEDLAPRVARDRHSS